MATMSAPSSSGLPFPLRHSSSHTSQRGASNPRETMRLAKLELIQDEIREAEKKLERRRNRRESNLAAEASKSRGGRKGKGASNFPSVMETSSPRQPSRGILRSSFGATDPSTHIPVSSPFLQTTVSPFFVASSPVQDAEPSPPPSLTPRRRSSKVRFSEDPLPSVHSSPTTTSPTQMMLPVPEEGNLQPTRPGISPMSPARYRPTGTSGSTSSSSPPVTERTGSDMFQPRELPYPRLTKVLARLSQEVQNQASSSTTQVSPQQSPEIPSTLVTPPALPEIAPPPAPSAEPINPRISTISTSSETFGTGPPSRPLPIPTQATSPQSSDEMLPVPQERVSMDSAEGLGLKSAGQAMENEEKRDSKHSRNGSDFTVDLPFPIPPDRLCVNLVLDKLVTPVDSRKKAYLSPPLKINPAYAIVEEYFDGSAGEFGQLPTKRPVSEESNKTPKSIKRELPVMNYQGSPCPDSYSLSAAVSQVGTPIYERPLPATPSIQTRSPVVESSAEAEMPGSPKLEDLIQKTLRERRSTVGFKHTEDESDLDTVTPLLQVALKNQNPTPSSRLFRAPSELRPTRPRLQRMTTASTGDLRSGKSLTSGQGWSGSESEEEEWAETIRSIALRRTSKPNLTNRSRIRTPSYRSLPSASGKPRLAQWDDRFSQTSSSTSNNSEMSGLTTASTSTSGTELATPSDSLSSRYRKPSIVLPGDEAPEQWGEEETSAKDDNTTPKMETVPVISEVKEVVVPATPPTISRKPSGTPMPIPTRDEEWGEPEVMIDESDSESELEEPVLSEAESDADWYWDTKTRILTFANRKSEKVKAEAETKPKSDEVVASAIPATPETISKSPISTPPPIVSKLPTPVKRSIPAPTLRPTLASSPSSIPKPVSRIPTLTKKPSTTLVSRIPQPTSSTASPAASKIPSAPSVIPKAATAASSTVTTLPIAPSPEVSQIPIATPSETSKIPTPRRSLPRPPSFAMLKRQSSGLFAKSPAGPRNLPSPSTARFTSPPTAEYCACPAAHLPIPSPIKEVESPPTSLPPTLPEAAPSPLASPIELVEPIPTADKPEAEAEYNYRVREGSIDPRKDTVAAFVARARASAKRAAEEELARQTPPPPPVVVEAPPSPTRQILTPRIPLGSRLADLIAKRDAATAARVALGVKGQENERKIEEAEIRQEASNTGIYLASPELESPKLTASMKGKGKAGKVVQRSPVPVCSAHRFF